MSDTLASFGRLHLTADAVYFNGAREFSVAPLDAVDGVAIVYDSKPLLAMLAIGIWLLGLIGAFTTDDTFTFVAGGLLGAIFFGLFLATRRAVLCVHAGSLRLVEAVSGANFGQAKTFANEVRVSRLRGRAAA